MEILELDASRWTTVLDFYNALISAIGAPRWHGTSVNAFIDSMIYGDINELQPPYLIQVRNASQVPTEVRESIDELSRFLAEARTDYRTASGREIEVSLESLPN